jgi:hypothetical protein
MARGGARRQPRDARGRFSSTGATARGGRIKKASGKRATVTAKAKGQAPSGTIGRRPGKPSKSSKSSANGIRPTGTLPRPQPSNSVKPTGRRAPRNNVRPYRPATADGKIGQIDRQIDSTMKGMVDEMKGIRDRAKKAKPEIDKMSRWMERTNARAIADRGKKGINGEIARIEIGTVGTGPGMKAIRRRAERASQAAARGSKPARRAQEIYASQMAFTGPGKPKAGKNNLRPGPRNKQGPPKRTRKPRKPRK